MCTCYECKACKVRSQTNIRVERFRNRQKNQVDATISDEELEQRLNQFFEREKDPYYYELRIILKGSGEYSLPSWLTNSIQKQKKYKLLRKTRDLCLPLSHAVQ